MLMKGNLIELTNKIEILLNESNDIIEQIDNEENNDFTNVYDDLRTLGDILETYLFRIKRSIEINNLN